MLEITTIHLESENYPHLLKEIHSPPQLLYVRGVIAPDEFCIAIVGTRKPTRYGIEATEKIVRDLALAAPTITIVSGLATGIDATAHRAALGAGLKTIGVLGSGMDGASFFPPQNRTLADEIVARGGAVISEYPEGTPARKYRFPERNRIVVGLSRGVLVIEAKERSGARITTRLAMEENREIFALPGPIFSPTSLWPNTLIQNGAKLVMSASDILEELGLATTPTAPRPEDLSEREKILFEILSQEPFTTDELKNLTNIATPDILSSISMLELKGLVKSLGNDLWMRVS